MNSPVALFCYNRPELLSQTLAALQSNPESPDTEIYIFSDGAKNELDKPEVEKTRALLNNISGFKKIHIKTRETNLGLATNIIQGVSQVLQMQDRIIVLEDDIKVSQQFLSFMNQALNRYKDEQHVWHISGWNYPAEMANLPDMFLWRVMNCWGWATWADKWRHYIKNPQALIENFTTEQIYRFNLDGCQDFWGQIVANHQYKLNTWAIFWYATIFKHNGLCLNPSKTLVDNTGFGVNGTHCAAEKLYKDELSLQVPIDWPNTFEESQVHSLRIKKFLLANNSAIPLNLSDYPLTKSEHVQLLELLTKQNYGLKNSLAQIWYLMDLIWDDFGLNNQQLDHDKLQQYYSHPVWLLNGLYTEADPDSITHRTLLAQWIKQSDNIKMLADIGGGIGFLAKIVASHNPDLHADIVEPFPSDYAKRILTDNRQVKFINELRQPYDCLTLMDVLEHVEDPVSMVQSLLPYIKDQGYLVTGNCFYPVIKCHLPQTFHLRYSFTEVMDALGFNKIDNIVGTHIEIFQKIRRADPELARQREIMSRTIYQNMQKDTTSYKDSNNKMQLNTMLSKFYNRLDEVINPQQKYIVYGAGTGARLLTEAVAENILFLVDKNSKNWNETRFGKKISPIEKLQSHSEKIIISVFGREKDISDYMINTLRIDPSRIIEL